METQILIRRLHELKQVSYPLGDAIEWKHKRYIVFCLFSCKYLLPARGRDRLETTFAPCRDTPQTLEASPTR
ncbi:hypothetical protein [Tumidithrix helvetica]|uniref:hypothetical protein n=1 Tax=Tumidithrix helvetica TaxID=3457545 RepID=UPI003CC61A7B